MEEERIEVIDERLGTRVRYKSGSSKVIEEWSITAAYVCLLAVGHTYGG